jgi:predicted flap endonuclease-1-like 5' DNA nuclease
VLASSVFKRKIVEDDLKIVEGIGPKIEELFHAAGIRTWRALAATSVERCRQILDEAGERYRIHKPDTWPKQCELAALGKWNELKEWQETLTGGREEI